MSSRERMIRIINDLENLTDKYSIKELIIATYLATRYGVHKCKYYIDESDLDKIYEVIDKKNTIFDEDLNYKVDKILNEERKNKTMNNFESVIIIAENVKEDEIKNINESITKLITDNKGEVKSVEEMGLKKLAYEIKKFKQAYYIVINFRIDPAIIPEIERFFRIKDEILKFIAVRKED